MPDKFIIPGATFNGDGTTSAQATVDGGVGAWNSINIVTGTSPSTLPGAAGSIAAGDVVYIRSKTSAGADVAISQAANLTFGSAAGTALAPITWILDDGLVWSGVSGTFTTTQSATFTWATRANNIFIARTAYNWRLVSSNANWFLAIHGDLSGILDGLLIDVSANVNAEPGSIKPLGTLLRCSLKFNAPNRNGFLSLADSGQTARLIDCELEQVSAGTPAYKGVFGMSATGARLEVIGGRYFGAGANANAALFRATNSTGGAGSTVVMSGFEVPPTVPAWESMSIARATKVDMTAADQLFGGFAGRAWGFANSRMDGFFPYLNAQLPTNPAVGWSWQLLPVAARDTEPMIAQVAMKMYTAAAAAATITQAFNIDNVFVSRLNTRNLWIEVTYIDNATGLSKIVSSRAEIGAGSSLSIGIAWSSASYGPTALVSRQIAVTTPTAIKQNTVVQVRVHCSTPSSGTAEMILACPDPQLT